MLTITGTWDVIPDLWSEGASDGLPTFANLLFGSKFALSFLYRGPIILSFEERFLTTCFCSPMPRRKAFAFCWRPARVPSNSNKYEY